MNLSFTFIMVQVFLYSTCQVGAAPSGDQGNPWGSNQAKPRDKGYILHAKRKGKEVCVRTHCHVLCKKHDCQCHSLYISIGAFIGDK